MSVIQSFIEECGSDRNILDQLTSYTILDKIGIGSFSSVYLSKRDDMLFAIKVIPVKSKKQRRSIFNEAYVLKYLSIPQCRPNVICFDSVRDFNTIVLIVTRYVPGIDLLDATSIIPFDKWIDVFKQIAVALLDIHKAGIVHNDIKPENILYVPDENRILLMDFGFACTIDPLLTEGYDIERCNPTSRRGTIQYAAPEIIDGLNLSPTKADVYSLGSTMYALLADKYPYEGDGIEYLRNVQNNEPNRFPEVLEANISPDLTQLIFEMLSKEPDKRPTMKEVVDRLNKL